MSPRPLARWPSAADLAPIPNRTVHLFGAAQYLPSTPSLRCNYSFAEACADDTHASPLVVHIAQEARFVVCRCDAGYARRDTTCVPCTAAEICPRFSDVALPNVCDVAADLSSHTFSSVAHLRDPIAAAPCARPSAAVFAPALPFYFGPHSSIVLPSASSPATISRCPDGQQYNPNAGNHGLVWKLATTFSANADFELRLPALERRTHLVAPDDLPVQSQELDARAHARARGRVWVPDRAAVCAACPANVTCRQGGASIEPCPGSARIGAKTCLPLASTEHVFQQPPAVPCPPLAVRRGTTCVCLGDRWPVPRDDLAAGFACLERALGLSPGTAHIGSVRGAVRGPDVAATLVPATQVLLVYLFVSEGPPRALPLPVEPDAWQLAGLTATHAVLYRRNVLADLGWLDLSSGALTTIPVSVPQTQQAVAKNVTQTQANSVPLRWLNQTGTSVEAAVPSNTSALSLFLAQQPPTGRDLQITLQAYQAAGIQHVEPQSCMIAHDAVFCPDEASRTPTGSTRNVTRVVLPSEDWRLTQLDWHALPDDGAVMFLYAFVQDNVQAWVATCFTHTGFAYSGVVLGGEEPTRVCPVSAWRRGTICVDPASCAVFPTPYSAPGLEARDLRVYAHGFAYDLSRRGLAQVAARGMLFGERVALDAGNVREVGWWYVQVVPRPSCALWYNGTCWPCAENERCTTRPKDVCSARGGRGTCACASGFAANPDGACRLCAPGSSFCQGGFARLCPPHSRTMFPGSTQCVCEAGYFRDGEQGACVQCPLHAFCRDEGLTPCPGHQHTLQRGQASASACLCAPGWTRREAVEACVPCAENFFKPGIGDDACTACAVGKVARNGSAACTCAAGSRLEPTTGNCVPCLEPDFACPAFGAPRPCRRRDFEAPRASDGACVCMDGWFRDLDGACQTCAPGMFCHGDRVHACPSGMTSPRLAAWPEQCFCANENEIRVGQTHCACARDTFRQVDRCVACPEHSTTYGVGATHVRECLCNAGYVWDAELHGCALCPRGHFCARGAVAPTPCPAQTFGPGPGLRAQQQCLPCSVALDTGYAGHPGQWHPVWCQQELRVVRASLALDAALNLSASTEAIFTVPVEAAQVQALWETYGVVTLRSPTQMRVVMHHDLPARILLDLVQEHHATAWEALKVATREVHGMTFAAVVVGVFCAELQHVAQQQAGVVLEACLAPLLFSTTSAMVDEVQKIVAMRFPGHIVRVQPTPQASVVAADLSRVPRPSVALAVGTQGLLLGPAVVGAWNREFLPVLSFMEYQFQAVPCREALRPVMSECAAGTAVPASGDEGMCAICAYGEFRNAEGVCQPCTTCKEYAVVCCGRSDAQCVAETQVERALTVCLNGRHDYGEACDPTDPNLALAKCCTAQCELKPGFYVGKDGCEARCGDQIVAEGVEVCDDLFDARCDAVSCTRLREI